ncbi:hypothetical protein [Novacetimonas hansenii]|uniref:hypothetical protein n=1 Tax=Novacetimonas hansenii TaxID=436 RepID=UPI0011C18BF6|nr:hypothetical protein [Novacetimonas hansenii]WEQ58311.1 hypothetical protein LV563_10640 [Novacetimonas hansenii]
MNDIEEQIHGLKFDAGKSIRYHSHLRSAWIRWDHWNKVFTLFLGTSVAGTAIVKYHQAEIITGMLTAFFSSLDIVLGFSDKSRLYDDLYKNWYDYLSELECIKCNALNEGVLIKFKQKRYNLERSEPGIMGWLERYSCYEEAIAQGLDVNDVWKLNFFQVFICKILG